MRPKPKPGFLLVARREWRWLLHDRAALILIFGVPLFAFLVLTAAFKSPSQPNGGFREIDRHPTGAAGIRNATIAPWNGVTFDRWVKLVGHAAVSRRGLFERQHVVDEEPRRKRHDHLLAPAQTSKPPDWSHPPSHHEERGVLRQIIRSVQRTFVMVEILKDNARPEAGAVYGAMDMPWAKLVGQIAHAYGK